MNPGKSTKLIEHDDEQNLIGNTKKQSVTLTSAKLSRISERTENEGDK